MKFGIGFRLFLLTSIPMCLYLYYGTAYVYDSVKDVRQSRLNLELIRFVQSARNLERALNTESGVATKVYFKRAKAEQLKPLYDATDLAILKYNSVSQQLLETKSAPQISPETLTLARQPDDNMEDPPEVHYGKMKSKIFEAYSNQAQYFHNSIRSTYDAALHFDRLQVYASDYRVIMFQVIANDEEVEDEDYKHIINSFSIVDTSLRYLPIGALPEVTSKTAQILASDTYEEIRETLENVLREANEGAFGINSNIFYDTFTQFISNVTLLADQQLEQVLHQATQLEQQSANEVRNRVIYITAVSVLMTLLLWYVVKQMTTAISTLKEASQKINKGDFDHEIKIAGKNELADLGEAFHQMGLSLKENDRVIRTILDNVSSGFLIINKEGKVQPGFTKSCAKLLNAEVQIDQSITQLLKLDASKTSMFMLALEQIFDDFMPEEVSLELISHNYTLEDKVLNIQASAIRNESNEVSSIMCTINDATKLVETQKRARRDECLIRILNQRSQFAAYVNDVREQLAFLYEQTNQKGPKDDLIRRTLHTIKGNSSVFGLEDLAGLVHQIEEASTIEYSHINSIERALKIFLKENFLVLKIAYHEDLQSTYRVKESDLLSIKDDLESQEEADPRQLKIDMLKWIYEMMRVPAQDLFGHLESLVDQLSHKLNKKASIKLSGMATLVDRQQLYPISQVVAHLIRNSMDHGIEAAGERGEKSEEGKIFLRVDANHQYVWRIKIGDDGRGINQEALLKRSIEKGLISPKKAEDLPKEEIFNLIFLDGVSTTQEATDVSGRGVGMAAVKEVIESQEGTIKIASELNIGTTFIIDIPKRQLKRQPEVHQKVS